MPVGSEGHLKSDVMCGLSQAGLPAPLGSDLGMAGSVHPPFERLAPHCEALLVLVGRAGRLSLAMLPSRPADVTAVVHSGRVCGLWLSNPGHSGFGM